MEGSECKRGKGSNVQEVQGFKRFTSFTRAVQNVRVVQKVKMVSGKTVGRLNILVLYDRWDDPDESNSAVTDKAPLTRTLDKKEVEEEVAETLGKLGHHATLHVLDGSTKSLHAVARIDCDLEFNLVDSFGGDDTADYCIAGYLELLQKRVTGSGSHGLLYAQDKGVAKKILEFHGIHTPVFARSYRGRLDFSHDLEFPVIVKPAREDGSIGIEFNAVVSSIRELMERIDWLHTNFDSPVLIEEYVEGREMYVGVLGNDNPIALPIVELDLSKLPHGRPRIAGAEVKWGKGTRAYRDTKSAIAEDLSEETIGLLQTTAVAVFQSLELRDYARIDMRLRPDGRVAVIEANPNPWLASKAEFAIAARKSGRNYTQLIDEIVDLAIARYGG
jgi:D-alanine-D-alanine ligase